jgi:hypothetical protein
MANGTNILVSVVDAVLCYGGSGTTAATLAETCGDVSLKIGWDTDEVNDRTTQAKGHVATLYELSPEVTFPADPTDVALNFFLAAAATGTPIAVYISDKAGLTGWETDYLVSEDADDQKIGSKIEHKFTLKRAARTGRIPPVVRR